MNNSLNEPERSRSHTLYCKVKAPIQPDSLAADVRRLVLVPTVEFQAAIRPRLHTEVSL